jgi:hypothetical protein
MFYYGNVHDPVTKPGYMAADIFSVVVGMRFLWTAPFEQLTATFGG